MRGCQKWLTDQLEGMGGIGMGAQKKEAVRYNSYRVDTKPSGGFYENGERQVGQPTTSQVHYLHVVPIARTRGCPPRLWPKLYQKRSRMNEILACLNA